MLADPYATNQMVGLKVIRAYLEVLPMYRKPSVQRLYPTFKKWSLIQRVIGNNHCGGW